MNIRSVSVVYEDNLPMVKFIYDDSENRTLTDKESLSFMDMVFEFMKNRSINFESTIELKKFIAKTYFL